jgi:hypothetical protein
VRLAGWIAILILLLLLCVAGAWARYAWSELGDVQMSGHGWAAMALGILFSLIVGIGLMGLVFYSSRKGYDEPRTSRRRPVKRATRSSETVQH